MPTATRQRKPSATRALPDLYTVREAAEILKVSRWYIYERIKAGDLAAVQLSNGNSPNQRISAEALEAFIKGRTSGGKK